CCLRLLHSVLPSLLSSSPLPPLPSFPTPRSSDLRLSSGTISGGSPNNNSPVWCLSSFTNPLKGMSSPNSFSNTSRAADICPFPRSEEHTSELQSRFALVCRLLTEKTNTATHTKGR